MAGDVSFTMAEADYVAANRDWFLGAIRKRKPIVRLAIGAITVFALGMVVAWADGDTVSGQIGYAAILFGVFAGLILLLYAMTYLLMPRRAGRLFRQQTAMHKPMSIAWSDDGLVHLSANGEGRYCWGDLHRWSDAKSAVLIYQTDQLFHVVPRRVLDIPQATDLRNTLKNYGPPQM